ncbi:MAG: DUF1992 domain-containing protein [Calditrichaeota bacterium]|nr:MAG: DUF1992 domain-containing protein [Calditrichota bacterium]
MFSKIAEEKILEAMEKGEFDNLPCKGKPIDLTDYFNTPAHLRIAYSLLKNANFIPEEVRLQREIAELKQSLPTIQDMTERMKTVRRINEKTAELDILLARYKKHR